MNNQVEKSFNNNYFRNDLEEIKNNFVKIKSMISGLKGIILKLALMKTKSRLQ